MKMNNSIIRVLYYAVVITFILGFFKIAFAEEKIIEIKESDFIFYIQTIDKQKKNLKNLQSLISEQNNLIENLISQNKLRKETDILNEEIIVSNYKKIIIQQTDTMKYMDKRIELYRQEVFQLESKGTRNRIEKLSSVATDTGTGCLTGSLFAGVGIVPGCAIGFVTGLTKAFFSDLI